jgi:A/G-specific adenine glycosylase
MEFSSEIIKWYHLNKRELPWRETKDPYLIWLSEIILQQTRVDQGLSYFLKFKENYPTVSQLANAPEDDVLKLWQGLGYYSRARNLHATAKIITEKYNSVFPKEYHSILELKGIGEYTAAAISSFCFKQPYPVIDGNVYRVLSRVFGLSIAIDSTEGKKAFKTLANDLIEIKQPDIYNQAIMEFGALQCTPKSPNCEDCPLLLDCYAYQNKVINELPFKSKKVKTRNRYFNYFIIHQDNKIYLKKRTEKDIWIGLFDFPLIETTKPVEDFNKILNHPENPFLEETKIKKIKKSIQYKHILSHQKIYATFWELHTDNNIKMSAHYVGSSIAGIGNFAVPKLIDNYLKTIL